MTILEALEKARYQILEESSMFSQANGGAILNGCIDLLKAGYPLTADYEASRKEFTKKKT